MISLVHPRMATHTLPTFLSALDYIVTVTSIDLCIYHVYLPHVFFMRMNYIFTMCIYCWEVGDYLVRAVDVSAVDRNGFPTV